MAEEPATPSRPATAATGGPGLGWLYAALALLGAFVGLAIGLSASPVVAVIVPLLFSLIAGGSGLYAVSGDLSLPATRDNANRLGRILIALVVPIFVASIYGIFVRTGASPDALWPHRSEEIEPPAALLTPPLVEQQGLDAALEVAALRYRLRLLGADETEVDAIARLAAERTSSPPALAAMVASFRALSARAAQVRESLTDDVAQRLDADSREKLGHLLNEVQFIRDQYGFYAERLEAMPGLPTRILLVRLQEDATRLSAAIHDRYDTVDWLINVPDLQTRLWDLEMAFFQEIARFGGVDWMSGGRIAEQVDKLLAATQGAQGNNRTTAAEDTLRPHFAP